MLILLSPAKTLDFDSPPKRDTSTTPQHLDDTDRLAAKLKQQTPDDLKRLMGISDKLAQLNHDRFADFQTPLPEQDCRPAIDAFQGDVYRGLQAETFTDKQIDYAQDHLRILSGFYGTLRPLDRILPYRLEMGTPLPTERGDDLYQFWGDRLTDAIAGQLEETGSKVLLNLASREYARSIDFTKLHVDVVSPQFKEWRDGKPRVITLYAKQARGEMAAWVIRNRAKTMRKLSGFDRHGYRYDESLSETGKPMFLRDGAER